VAYVPREEKKPNISKAKSERGNGKREQTVFITVLSPSGKGACLMNRKRVRQTGLKKETFIDGFFQKKTKEGGSKKRKRINGYSIEGLLKLVYREKERGI